MAAGGFHFSKAGREFVALGDSERTPAYDEGALCDVGDFALHPAAAVLSYGVACFEGLKVFRSPDGKAAMFRPAMNADRMRASAEALGLAPPPADLFVRGCLEVARSCATDIPPAGKGSLYLRPILFGTDPILGVAAGRGARLHIFGAPVGNYFDGHSDGGASGLRLRVQKGGRVPPFGMGGYKLSANYAVTLKHRREVHAAGDHEALYLDARTHTLIEETASSNVCAVMKDGRLVTAPLNGSILPGVTRDSLLRIAREDLRIPVEERDLPLAEVIEDGAEFFVCGTAVVVGAVASIHMDGRVHKLPKVNGPTTVELKRRLVEVQEGRAADPRGWRTAL